MLALLAPALVAAEADTGYGYAPQVYCRDTNTSVYAQVCVPAFTTKVTPVTLDIKKVVDNDYCYEQIRTVCEETTKVQPRKICTYKYNSVKETLGAQTTQVLTHLPPTNLVALDFLALFLLSSPMLPEPFKDILSLLKRAFLGYS